MFTLRRDEIRIGFLADTDVTMPWFEPAARQFQMDGITTVLFIGDPLRIPRGGEVAQEHLDRVTSLLADCGQTWLVTAGIHADPGWSGRTVDRQGLRWASDRIAVIPRGHRWTWRDTQFVSLGGGYAPWANVPAAAAEFPPAETPTDADVSKVIAGGPADVMVTFVRARGQERGTWISDAVTAVRPRMLVHCTFGPLQRTRQQSAGAMHPTEAIGLPSDGGLGSYAILDLSGGPEHLTLTSTPPTKPTGATQ